MRRSGISCGSDRLPDQPALPNRRPLPSTVNACQGSVRFSSSSSPSVRRSSRGTGSGEGGKPFRGRTGAVARRKATRIFRKAERIAVSRPGSYPALG